MKKYKVTIEHKKCMGCMICVSAVPEFFYIDNQVGLVGVKDFKKIGDDLVGEIEEKDLDKFELAADSCPQLIIKIQK